jgi:ABC-type multidrug transport system ATPase subunit
VVEGLTKNYSSFVAVANLNFAVHHGECFGNFRNEIDF